MRSRGFTPLILLAFIALSCEDSDIRISAEYIEGLKAKREITVVLMGDSITSGNFSVSGLSLGRRLKPRLAELLGMRVSMIETGDPDETFDHALRRLDEDVFFFRPDVVLVMLGMNDISRPNFDENLFGKIAADFFQTMKKRDFLAFAVTPAGYRSFYSGRDDFSLLKSLNEIISLHAGLNHYPVIDLTDRVNELHESGSGLVDSLFADTVHLNDRGQDFVAGFICDSIRSIMEKGGGRR